MNNDEIGEWPLWRICLKRMRESPHFGYGAMWDTAWFEAQLSCKRDSNEFAFAMLDLRQELEDEDGYYLQANTIIEESSGIRKETWSIPDAVGHGEQATHFESKMKRYASRAVRLLDKTLHNATAKLDESQRANLDKKQEIAATRLILLSREKSIADFVRANKPKMLK